jgi:hypothetical protein
MNFQRLSACVDDTRCAHASGTSPTASAGEIVTDRRSADRHGRDAAGLESHFSGGGSVMWPISVLPNHESVDY